MCVCVWGGGERGEGGERGRGEELVKLISLTEFRGMIVDHISLERAGNSVAAMALQMWCCV